MICVSLNLFLLVIKFQLHSRFNDDSIRFPTVRLDDLSRPAKKILSGTGVVRFEIKQDPLFRSKYTQHKHVQR